jgi:hypothetical protein
MYLSDLTNFKEKPTKIKTKIQHWNNPTNKVYNLGKYTDFIPWFWETWTWREWRLKNEEENSTMKKRRRVTSGLRSSRWVMALGFGEKMFTYVILISGQGGSYGLHISNSASWFGYLGYLKMPLVSQNFFRVSIISGAGQGGAVMRVQAGFTHSYLG